MRGSDPHSWALQPRRAHANGHVKPRWVHEEVVPPPRRSSRQLNPHVKQAGSLMINPPDLWLASFDGCPLCHAVTLNEPAQSISVDSLKGKSIGAGGSPRDHYSGGVVMNHRLVELLAPGCTRRSKALCAQHSS